jgi:hypothetical protein
MIKEFVGGRNTILTQTKRARSGVRSQIQSRKICPFGPEDIQIGHNGVGKITL